MKKCINCNFDVRETDTFCRNCGSPLQSNKKYIFINVIIIFMLLLIIGMIALFISSYMLTK